MKTGRWINNVISLLAFLLVVNGGTWLGPPLARSQDQAAGDQSLLPEPVRLRISFLLQKAEEDLDAGRLGGPGEDNALARFEEIGLLDPGSVQAEEGFEKVVQRALLLAEEAARGQDLDRARELLRIADQAKGGDERVAGLKKRLPALAKEGRAAQTAKPAEAESPPQPPAVGEMAGPSPVGPPAAGAEEVQTPGAPAPAVGDDRFLKGERALRQALEAYLDRDYDRSRELYEQARELIPEEPAVVRLGDRLAEASQGTRDQAEEMLNQAEAALAQGEPERAGELLDRAARVLGWGGRVAALKIRIQERAEGGGEPLSKGEMVNSIGMKFVLIPAGKFRMGSPVQSQTRSDELPRHQVEISKPFWMGIYEVTQAQWQEIMGDNPSRFKGEGGTLPVESISLAGIREFIDRLNQRDKARVHRLPTEAEWEYACRAGTETSYSFGDDPKDLDEYCWYWGTAAFQTHRVGQKKPNPWGLYDLHGNVWEVCRDWYGPGYYGRTPERDPQGPEEGEVRVARGGSFMDGPSDCRTARRGQAGSGMRYGFRLVVETN